MKTFGYNIPHSVQWFAEKDRLELQSLIRRGCKTDDDQGRFDYFDANYNWKVSTCSHCGKVLVYEFSQREIPQYESYLSIEAIKEEVKK